jgi:predicted anti-sigma-YlaC factor YlaD
VNTVNGLAGDWRQDHDSHDALRVSLGAYLLGALDESESQQVFGHLLECPACREEYGQLLTVRTVLDRVGEMAALQETAAFEPRRSTADVGRGPASRRAARKPNSRRRRLGLAAAGVVLAATASVGGVLLVGNQAGTPTTRTVAATGPYGITAVVQFHSEAWGTSLQMKMSNVPADYTCVLTVVDKDGHSEVAATWSAGPGSGAVTVPGAAAIPATAIDHFSVAISPGINLVVPAS